MPIVDIEVVVDSDGESGVSKTQTRELADALGEVFESGPTGTWVRVRFLSEQLYAENLESRGSPMRPVFVTVLKAQRPGSGRLAEEMRKVASVVAAVLSRLPENVHVLYEPKAAGRIAFGGVLRRA